VTDFKERLEAVNRLYSDGHQNEVNDFLLTLANDMEAEISELRGLLGNARDEIEKCHWYADERGELVAKLTAALAKKGE